MSDQDIQAQIDQKVKGTPIVLFMKGTPQFPQCGFSMRASQALTACGVEFDSVDVLAMPEFRAALPQYSNWPTFPQLFIGGELVGGCDIVLDLFQQGELQRMTREASA